MPCFIYCITSVDGKCYVGSAKNVENRIKQHRYGRSDRARTAIHAAIKKYGWEYFKVEILEETCPLLRNDRENYWINIKNSLAPNGYNLVLADYTYLTQEQINRRSEGRRKFDSSPEGKKSNSERSKRVWQSEGFRDKTCANIKKSWENPEVRKRTVASHKQRWDSSPELKDHYRELIKNTLQRPDVRKRVVESNKKRWEDPNKRIEFGRHMSECRAVLENKKAEAADIVFRYLESSTDPSINAAWEFVKLKYRQTLSRIFKNTIAIIEEK